MTRKHAAQFLKAKAVDRDTYTIRFVFSSPTVDRHGEVVSQTGWKLDNYVKNPVVLWSHDPSEFPIGKASNLSIVNGNLEGDVTFAYQENENAATVFELCAGGFLNAGSVGFDNLKWMYDEVTDVLTLLENELYEFSIVNIPANPDALAKAIEGMKEKNVEKRVIDHVETLRKEMQEKSENRFKDLGEEVKPTEEEKPKEEVPADPEPETPPVEVTAPIKTDQPAEESAEAKAKAAIETLCACTPELIQQAVAALTKVAPKNADTDETKVEKTPAPQGPVYSVNSINRAIRLLIRAVDRS